MSTRVTARKMALTPLETAQGSPVDDRITRLRSRYQQGTPKISIERARLYTEKWRQLEKSGLPANLRVALAMKHVYQNMSLYLDPDDRLAGTWTEFFLGLPIDIERGLYNGVLESELDKPAMLAFRLKSAYVFIRYLVRKEGMKGLYENIRNALSNGPSPINMGLTPLNQREINAFEIDRASRKHLQKELLPYWKGRSMADRVAWAMDQATFTTTEMREFTAAVPATPAKQAIIISPGASIATYQGHLILDHEQVMRRGLLAMKQDVADQLAERVSHSREERKFLRSLEIALKGVEIFAHRLANKVGAEKERASTPRRIGVLSRMHDCCERVPLHPARTFREALQSLWTVRVAVELAHITNVHALGRLDQILYPYYQQDCEAGILTREEARTLMEELLLKVMVQSIRPESNLLSNFYFRYEGSTPVTIGGVDRTGADATNEMTYIILEAACRAQSVTSLVVRIHRDTPEALHMALSEALHQGSSNISMMNDEIFIKAMLRRGHSLADSRDYAITGCTDAIVPGKTGGISFSGLLLNRILDVTLRNGQARTMLGAIDHVGPRTGDPDGFATFEEFLEAFRVQADYLIRVNAEASNLRDRLFADYQPAPYISAFIQGCLKNRKDVTQGGAVYDFSGINMINSVANLVDSLHVIRQLLFKERSFTFKTLLSALDKDFAGHEDILAMIDAVEGRWGNGHPEVDALARRVTTLLFEATDKYSSYKGGPLVPFINSMTAHTMEGRISLATPDGRRAATPFAASCNPYNVERRGITGVLRSVAALDFKNILGCAVNLRCHPSAIGGNEGARRKWIALMRTYFAMGGAQVQPTVASGKTLRAAQADPEAYQGLMVKVGGYSTYFVDLGREIQNEVIARTEHCAQ